jgi:hypothetical protein
VVVIVSFTNSVLFEDFDSLFTVVVFKDFDFIEDFDFFADLAICVGALVGEGVGHRSALLPIMMAKV